MKTITEIFGLSLVAHIKAYQELIASGKTAEEAGPAFGEAQKLEGDKLKHLLNAIDMVKTHSEGLKRVVVMQVGETEKAPNGAVKKDEFHYVMEYFPRPASESKARHDDHGGRDDRRGGKGGKRGERKGGRDDSRRGGRDENRAPRPAPLPGQGTGTIIVTGVAATAAPAREKTEGGDRPRRQRPPRERKPRPEPAPVDPSRITGRIIPKAEFEKMKVEAAPVVAATESAAPAVEATKSE
jgi:hypothetical protein